MDVAPSIVLRTDQLGTSGSSRCVICVGGVTSLSWTGVVAVVALGGRGHPNCVRAQHHSRYASFSSAMVALLPFHAFLMVHGLVPWWKEAVLAILLVSVVLRVREFRAKRSDRAFTILFVGHRHRWRQSSVCRFGYYDLSPYLTYVPLVLHQIPYLPSSTSRQLNLIHGRPCWLPEA